MDRLESTTAERSWPLVVDMDGTFLKVDTLYETFALAVFSQPWRAFAAFSKLPLGIARFKTALSDIAVPDAEIMPVREDLVEFIRQERGKGRHIHLATAANRRIAARVVEEYQLFDGFDASDGTRNLKGSSKAARLAEHFPDGYAYVGDSTTDLPVWAAAKAALIVDRGDGLPKKVNALGTPIERIFPEPSDKIAAWWKALRPHQWAKNALVFIPPALGWTQIGMTNLVSTLIAALLLCAVASLTYCVNDIADLGADRRHWSKRNRPFASGRIPVRDGMIAAALGIPLLLILGAFVSPGVGLGLLAYVVITLAYSFGLKRVAILDTFIIAALFSLRLLIGTEAAALEPSPWLLTFSMFFFFSLAIAKRHTEILRAGERTTGKIGGRGYHVEDREVTLAFGVASAIASILIMVQFLMAEVFSRDVYSNANWLWAVPAVIFLWISRVWLLSHRGFMTDDPVIFALKDRLSLGLGLVVVVAFLLAV
ncbi:UbiA family prenyltransferase [Kaistia algarum]|nr:UbiA family prenyltransferase [Kaistia algarum]